MYALWSVLKPRGSVISKDDPTAGPGLWQDCVTVDCVAVGDLSPLDGEGTFQGQMTGFWTVEFQDHAIGRLIQRDPTADIETALWQAHCAALDTRLFRSFEFGRPKPHLPAGNGVFVVTFVKSHDLDAGSRDVIRLYLQARTWLHRDQLSDEPEPVGKDVGERLGDNLFLPLPLRHLSAVSDEVSAP